MVAGKERVRDQVEKKRTGGGRRRDDDARERPDYVALKPPTMKDVFVVSSSANNGNIRTATFSKYYAPSLAMPNKGYLLFLREWFLF